MISRALLKSEIDKMTAENLDLLYRIVKAFENGASKGNVAITSESQDFNTNLDCRALLTEPMGVWLIHKYREVSKELLKAVRR